MDHRLREIEQWVEKAREDLQEEGREAYLRKLYLLDAEIRAVIKENDTETTSSKPAPVFSFSSINAAMPVMFGAVLALAAAAVIYGWGPFAVFGGSSTVAGPGGIPAAESIFAGRSMNGMGFSSSRKSPAFLSITDPLHAGNSNPAKRSPVETMRNSGTDSSNAPATAGSIAEPAAQHSPVVMANLQEPQKEVQRNKRAGNAARNPGTDRIDAFSGNQPASNNVVVMASNTAAKESSPGRYAPGSGQTPAALNSGFGADHSLSRFNYFPEMMDGSESGAASSTKNLVYQFENAKDGDGIVVTSPGGQSAYLGLSEQEAKKLRPDELKKIIDAKFNR